MKQPDCISSDLLQVLLDGGFCLAIRDGAEFMMLSAPRGCTDLHGFYRDALVGSGVPGTLPVEVVTMRRTLSTVAGVLTQLRKGVL